METSYGAQQMKKIMAGELAADGRGRAGVALGWPVINYYHHREDIFNHLV